MGLVITVGVKVPMSIDVEVESGDTIKEAVELHFILMGLENIDGTPTIYKFSCPELGGISIDDTIYECNSCGKFGTDELCENCSEEDERS